jgi:hypothetical protein
MNVNELNWHTQQDTPVAGHDRALSQKTEPAEAIFLGCVYIGSIGGAIGGVLVSYVYLGSLYPTACGMLGCTIGSLVLCAMAPFWTAVFCPGPQPTMVVSESVSVEERMEEVIHHGGENGCDRECEHPGDKHVLSNTPSNSRHPL